jgi:16S rRNA G966 N2-methylase RsmD
MQIIYYDKLFPICNNININKLKIDIESISYISSPQYADKITTIISNHINDIIHITDCTAGCGGDTISFLSKFKKVYSIEINIIRYYYLLNNIMAYNYINKSVIFCGNFVEIIKKILDHNVLYIDPPWGGKDYKKKTQLQLYINNILLEDIIIDFLVDPNTKKIPQIIVLKLPINYDLKHCYNKLKDYAKIFLYDLKKMFIIVLEVK